MTKKQKQPFISEKFIRFIFGILVFSTLVIGGTYYLQSSLIILKSLGIYAHWAMILILLPVISGLLQHLVGSPARLIVAILGSIASTSVLYPIYAEEFWAIPPNVTDTIFFTFAVAGIGFTSSINPFDRHINQRQASRNRKNISEMKQSNHKIVSHDESDSSDGFLNSGMIRTFELMLSLLSFVLAIWGTFFLGSTHL